VKAGKAKFAVKNEGGTIHGLAMSLTPLKADGDHIPHDSMLFKGRDLEGGASETITADLKPGTYELICHIADHYMARQKLAFAVPG
jgi:uncharacterized cupredoxin-like copper-binding protein